MFLPSDDRPFASLQRPVYKTGKVVTMREVSSKQIAFQREISNLENTIAAIEAHRGALGDLAADTALDLLRERLATLIRPDAAPDERKRVTVLFADVSGYTALSENLDPEDVATIMNRLFEAVTVEIHRYGGTIDKYAGDAVMALFGAPQALENHEEMAVRAALGMQQVIKAFSAELEKERGFRLQMRIGLNTGEVLAGLVGGLHARSYTVMGDTVNLAARLESAAPVGGILASEQTARKLHAIFDFDPPQTIRVKGKSDEIKVYRVLGEKAKRGRVRGLEGLRSPMVGRDVEFASLQAAVTQATTQGTWQATAVTGDAGLGKSRLQHELVAWVMQAYPQTAVLLSRCFHHTRTTPYHFLAELMRGLFHISREASAETAVQLINDGLQRLAPQIDATERQFQLGSLASILGITIPDDPLAALEPEQRRDRTFLSLERIFQAAAARQPCLLVVDDLHWADALSLEFLERMLQWMPRQGAETGSGFWLILSRPVENQDSTHGRLLSRLAHTPYQTMTIQSLDTAQAETLIQNLLGQSIPADLRRLITSHAQGNPFYVEEVLRSLIEEGTLKKNGEWKVTQNVADVRIPPSVQDVLAARIDRLPPDDKRITQHAAIIGRIFWQRILNQITAADTVEPTLTLLELRQLADRLHESQLSEDWEWVFHHGMIQEVAYGAVPKSTRRVVHRQVAQILEEQLGEQTAFLLPLIADHYESGDVPQKAIEYLGRAGAQAAAQFANQDAISYYTRAINLLVNQDALGHLNTGQLNQLYRLLLGRAEVYHLTAQRESQIDDLRRLNLLAEMVGDKSWRIEIALNYGRYYEALSQFQKSIEKAEEAVQWARQIGDARQEVNGLTAWALGLLRQGNFEEAKDLAQKAQQIAQENHNQHGETVSLAHLGIVYYFLGQLEYARDSLESSLFLARERKDLHRQTSCLTNLVGIYHALGDYAQAKRCCEEALEIARIVGDRAKEITIVNNLGNMYHALGNLRQARIHLEESFQLSQLLNNRLGESMAANNLSLVLQDLGQPEQAQFYAEHAVKIDRDIGDRRGEGYSLTALAFALEGIGDFEKAATAHDSALKLRKEIGQDACAMDNLAGLASIAHKKGDAETAVSYTDEILNWIGQNGIGGIEYPIRVYLTCAAVLESVSQLDKRAKILNEALDLLQTQAQRISDLDSRHDFIENVPLHKQLLTLAKPK